MAGPASQRQFLVTIDGIGEFFATLSGGEVTADVGDSYDGGKKRPDKVAGNAVTANLVCGRPYKITRDQPIIDRLEKQVGSFTTTITRQPADADFTPVGKPTVYPDCLLVRVTPPEMDASSSDAASYELEWATPGSA